METHLAMVCQNHMTGYLPWQTGTAKNLHTRRWGTGTGAPPHDNRRQPTPEQTPRLPGTPPTPTSNNCRAQPSQIVNLLDGYAYSHTSLPCAESFSFDASTQDSQHNTDSDPAMLTDEVTSTGWYTISCVVMQLTFILKTTVAYWATIQVMTSIDWQAWHYGDYYFQQLADTIRYILKDILICIIKEQCSNQEESIWKC